MVKVVLKRVGNALVPVDDEGISFVNATKHGREIMCEVNRARNPRQHRLFFAILKFIVEHTEIESIEAAKSAIKVATGQADPVIDANTGETKLVLRSISYESMPQDEFRVFFNDAINVITTRWMPEGAAADAVRNEIVAMVDGPMMRGIEQHRRE